MIISGWKDQLTSFLNDSLPALAKVSIEPIHL